MRYPFDSQAQSFINRVEAIVGDRTEIEYGVDDVTLLSALWIRADLNTDWGGESDGLSEFYPEVDEMHKRVVMENSPLDPVEVLYEQAYERVVNFENKLYLACLVVNALFALDADVERNAFKSLAKINVEFRELRQGIMKEIKDLSREQAQLC